LINPPRASFSEIQLSYILPEFLINGAFSLSCNQNEKPMALTTKNSITVGGSGNYSPTSQYYGTDMEIVQQQPGAVDFLFTNVIFRGDAITVYAARDNNANLLRYMALPCPPYYHLTRADAAPGNVLV
jgi:hypothetical protein